MEHGAKLVAEHEERLNELTELNRLSARRLAESESKCTALQSSKLISWLQHTHMHQSNKSLIIDKTPTMRRWRRKKIIKNTQKNVYVHIYEIVCCCARSGGLGVDEKVIALLFTVFILLLLLNWFFFSSTLSSSGHWLVLMMNRSQSSTRFTVSLLCVCVNFSRDLLALKKISHIHI